MEMTDELRDQLKAECDAYRKELEALSADELMKRYFDSISRADNIFWHNYFKVEDFKVEDGKLWHKYFKNPVISWDYEWTYWFDGADPGDRETVIEKIMTDKKYEIQRRLDQSEQRVEPKPKPESAKDKDKKSEDEKDKQFWIGLMIFVVVGLMVAFIVGFTAFPI